jgi:hypothetical protein
MPLEASAATLSVPPSISAPFCMDASVFWGWPLMAIADRACDTGIVFVNPPMVTETVPDREEEVVFAATLKLKLPLPTPLAGLIPLIQSTFDWTAQSALEVTSIAPLLPAAADRDRDEGVMPKLRASPHAHFPSAS